MKNDKIMTNPIWVVVLAVLCNVLWGSAFPFVKLGYEAFNITTEVSDKILFAGARFFISGVILFLAYVLIHRTMPKLKKENLKTVGELGIIQTTAQYIFFYIGLSHTSAANGSIVNSMNVFISAILAHIIYTNDKMNLRKWIGCIIGFAGVLMVTLGQGRANFSWNGEGFIIVANFAFAFGSVLAKKATQLDDSVSVTAYNLAFGGAVLILLGLVMGGSLHQVTGKGIAILIYLSCLSAISFALWTMLLQYNSIGKICIYNFVIPIAGTLLSGLVLHENILQVRYGFSLVLVTAGICIVNFKKE